MRTLRHLLPFLLVVAGPWLHAAKPDPCFPPKPKEETSLVFQFTNFLDRQQEAYLNTKLTNFARETSNRIAVVVVDTLCGYPPSDFAFLLGEQWGFGKKGIDNGVLILVKPHGRAGDRHVFIAVGYGLEGAIPDLIAKRITDEEILPRFRDGDYYGGLDKATDVLMALAKGEIDVENYGKGEVPWVPILLIIGFFVFIFAMAARNAYKYAQVNDIDFWTAWNLLNAASSSHQGRWRGFTDGGGGSGFTGGGGGGGGFGGFGGGGFGGGGAGGSW